jgi:hypothetical protein
MAFSPSHPLSRSGYPILMARGAECASQIGLRKSIELADNGRDLQVIGT